MTDDSILQAATDRRVHEEWQRFCKALPELLKQFDEGTWVVFLNGEVKHVFDKSHRAYRWAVANFGIDGGFVVAQVKPRSIAWRDHRKIYVASSWRNTYQSGVVAALRDARHEVYDFKNPTEGEHGFGWREIEPCFQSWTPEQFRRALAHPVAQRGFEMDKAAMEWADTCVLVLPAGRSAHIEAGWFAGAGRELCIYQPEACEPELMYLLASAPISITLDELLELLDRPTSS